MPAFCATENGYHACFATPSCSLLLRLSYFPSLICKKWGNWTTCGYANLRIANSCTSQLMDWTWDMGHCLAHQRIGHICQYIYRYPLVIMAMKHKLLVLGRF